jgi:orotate phosphoribosyltransferase
VRETVPLLRAVARIELAGLVVAVDRQERGAGPQGALQELQAEFGMPCFAIATLDGIVAALSAARPGRAPLDAEVLERIQTYRARYGAPQASGSLRGP